MPSNKWEEAVKQALDAHAEYYIRETMKFFDENGESPALSKNNDGDLAAKLALTNAVKELVEENYPKLDQAEVPDSMEEYHRSVKLLNTYQANLLKAIGGEDD